MRKRQRIAAAGLLLVAVVCALTLGLRALFQEPEPSYRGKNLSHWIRGASLEQGQALNAMGTNAVPHLMKWATYNTPKWKALGYAGLNRLRAVIKKPPLTDRRELLGEDAASALMELTFIYPEIGRECREFLGKTNLSNTVRRRMERVVIEDQISAPFRSQHGPMSTNASLGAGE